MDASFVTTIFEHHAILRCKGDLDLATRDDLAAALAELAFTDSHRVVVDLAEVTFMDCGSISAIEALARWIAPARTTYVVAPQGVVRRLLGVVAVDPLVHVRPNLAQIVTRAAG